MFKVSVEFDEKEFEKEFIESAIKEVKKQIRKKVNVLEFHKLKFEFDKKSGSVIVDGPDEIKRKIDGE